ncbi:MAG: hypothetical protein NC831_07305 [Candidatus Omnitrophica bacterium]|nr:hypothetical protein [Candidatus Omnitrophota bacterium]MCM8828689.1 hypothetical protein [Candidatus Omnitrophota bacterium]
MTYLNILWHFHQPWYVMPGSNSLNSSIITFRALYNYYPMAKMIEESGVRLTCNFTPSLLLQIKNIAEGNINDEFQGMLESESSSDIAKVKMFSAELPDRIKKKSAILKTLSGKLDSEEISKKKLSDIVVWMHLVCFHPLMGKYFPEIEELKKKGVGFSQKDREILLGIEKKAFSDIIPLYRKLVESGLIEISTTPGYHPIMPLIYDISISTRTHTSYSMPDVKFSYPEDVRAHIEMGIKTAESIFGIVPAGLWPAEGSISSQVLDEISNYDILWIGADEQILSAADVPEKDISTAIYTWKDRFSIFFRNHGFSDRLGFIYQSWDEKKAAVDLIKKIEEFSGSQERILTIILDGENPWEWYRQEATVFLKEFYEMAVSNKNISMQTLSQGRNLNFKKISLSSIPPGSWMGLHFDNWIGSSDANRLWEILSNARQMVKQHASKIEQYDRLKELILMAESSDFFWWMSVPAEKEVKMKFYTQFQAIISEIYRRIGVDVPFEVFEAHVFETKVNQPLKQISPVIDGKVTDFFEWAAAAEINIQKLWTTFQPFNLPVSKLFYGYDRKFLYIRIDFTEKVFSSVAIESKKSGTVFSSGIGTEPFVKENIGFDRCIEISIPLEKTGDENGLNFAIRLETSDGEIRIPPAGFFAFTPQVFEEDWVV